MTHAKFTEASTEAFYDGKDSLYRSFWDEQGSLHWGYFDRLQDVQPEEFLDACRRWNEFMLDRSGITSGSRVLDVGCGNGNTAFWLSRRTGCEVVGVDLSGVRIRNAKAMVADHSSLCVSFHKASATNLPFPDQSFTHVWSQATLYHIHEHPQALHEISRVLQDRGTLIFDDLVTPVSKVSASTRKHVYDRLLFAPGLSHQAYIDALHRASLLVFEAVELDQHLHQSYACLAELVRHSHPHFGVAYDQMCAAITAGELGWSFYRCEKITDRLSWIYQADGDQRLQDKYDAWARFYDVDLDGSYRGCPVAAARVLARVLPDTSARILDAGAGTGMVGEALAERGYSDVTGVDFSERMLDIADQKRVYRALHHGDLEAGLTSFQEESFAAVLAVGVFTHGHVDPRALRDLFRLLQPNGLLVLTVRVDYHVHSASLREILTELPGDLMAQEEFTIFDTEPMYALVFRKSRDQGPSGTS